MPRQKIPKSVRAAGKRAAQYSERLKILRKFTGEFDAKRFEKIYLSKPQSARGKREKKAALQKVARTFARLKPFVHRPHKIVRPTSPRNLASLRKFVGMTNVKKLRAVPVPTDRAKTLRVTFDKKGRVEIREGKSRWKTFLFPHKPKDSDDIIEMTEAMVPKMPRGIYTLMTRHHFLIPTTADRDQLVETLRRFAFQYRESPEFLSMLYGFKWVSGSYERALEFQKYMRTERGRQKLERKRLKSESAARVIAEMNRKLKSGKLPRQSARARKTGRR